MESNVNSVLFDFDSNCDCSPYESVTVAMPDVLESGTPLCPECDKEFLLRNTCRVLALANEA